MGDTPLIHLTQRFVLQMAVGGLAEVADSRLLLQLFLYFQLARHKAREKEVSLTSKEEVLLSQLIHFLMA